MRLLFSILVVGLIVVAAWFGVLHYYAGVPLPLLARGERPETLQREPTGKSIPAAAAEATSPKALSQSPAATLPPSVRYERPVSSTDFYSLQNARALEQRNRQATRSILSLPWVADGISEGERETIEALIWLAVTQEQLFQELIRKPWLASEEAGELEVVVIGLEQIALNDPIAASDLISMPFLTQLEPADALAVKSLTILAHTDLPSFKNIMNHHSTRDGISNREARIVGLAGGVSKVNPELALTLLDPTITTIDERSIVLPLTGEVTLSIIRTRRGAARAMDLLEHAVRSGEDLMGKPFPVRHVALLFEDAVSGSYAGTNFGTHVAILPKFDASGESREAQAAGRVIAHEVAHYYWNSSEDWLDEGAAEFMGAFAELTRTGAPLEPDNYPCDLGSGIGDLEARNYSRDAERHICNYATGERLFLDLYRTLGDDHFWRGFRKLNMLVKEIEAEGDARAGIEEVRSAFAVETSPDGGESSTEVIERWYTGYGIGQEEGPDKRPVVAELPEVYGWVERAYVSLTEGGPPSKTFSISELDHWAWLTLEYSHDYAGPPQELDFEAVEYYEDGFPYRRNTLTITATRNHSGGVQWLSVGPGPDQAWAEGRHWIYVYHEGRKVAQVDFVVTP